MNLKTLSLLAAALACVTLITASCAKLTVRKTVVQKHGHGPPPHAPAHGYRYKHHHGAELIYDSGRGVYVVVGLDGHYYFDGRYYRLRNGQWQVGVHIKAGPWEFVSEESIPPGLRGRKKGKAKSKEHPGRGHGARKKKNNW